MFMMDMDEEDLVDSTMDNTLDDTMDDTMDVTMDDTMDDTMDETLGRSCWREKLPDRKLHNNLDRKWLHLGIQEEAPINWRCKHFKNLRNF